MASSTSVSTYDLPHSHKEWTKVKEKLKNIADKKETGLLALAEAISLSPYWTVDSIPMLNVLKKALGDGKFYNEEQFCNDILPYIASRALAVESLFPSKTIQLLLSGISEGVTITRSQASCILALAFFFLFNKPSKHGSRYQQLNLVDILEYGFFKSQQSKCLCLIGYFERLWKAEVAGDEEYLKRCITIERKVLDSEKRKAEFWTKSELPLCEFEPRSEGLIESSHGCLQADFANEYIGGGVLQQGNVQEEIRFVINPECLVSILYCESMATDESILITGAEQFSTYSGYGGNFTYTGPYTDDNPVDPDNRCSVSIVAIDAIPAAWLPGGSSYQYAKDAVLREVCKAFCGFSFQVPGDTAGGKSCVPVATGNWGCGAFGGNKELKTVLQWMAGTQAGRKVFYYTFRDQKFCEQQTTFIKAMYDAKMTVGQVMNILLEYEFCKKVQDKGTFQYILSKIQK